MNLYAFLVGGMYCPPAPWATSSMTTALLGSELVMCAGGADRLALQVVRRG